MSVVRYGGPFLIALSIPVFWYAIEALLALVAGWPLSWLSPLSWISRDLLLPVLWAEGWTGGAGRWRRGPHPGRALRRVGRAERHEQPF